MALDLSQMSPNDAVTALRSYPRRYRAALAPIDDDNVEELAERAGPDGESALQKATDTARTWTVLLEALRQIQLNDSPVVHAAVADPAQRHWDAPARDSLATVLDDLQDGAEALATAITSVAGDAWGRRADVAGGGSVTALDVVREAVRVGRENLDAAERTIAAVRD